MQKVIEATKTIRMIAFNTKLLFRMSLILRENLITTRAICSHEVRKDLKRQRQTIRRGWGIEGKGTFFPSNPKRNYIGERATMQSIHAPSERRGIPEKGWVVLWHEQGLGWANFTPPLSWPGLHPNGHIQGRAVNLPCRQREKGMVERDTGRDGVWFLGERGAVRWSVSLD